MTDVPNVPVGFVRIRSGVAREEAVVVQGLLESCGIRVAMVGADVLQASQRAVARVVDIAVAEDRAEEAAAILEG